MDIEIPFFFLNYSIGKSKKNIGMEGIDKVQSFGGKNL